MGIDAKEKTALETSTLHKESLSSRGALAKGSYYVGADERQSIQTTTNSISTYEPEINHQIENSEENFEETMRKMQRMMAPDYLHTYSMTELYETTFNSRPSIIGGLLDAGAYLLVGAPKIGKSFLVAQIAYHVSTGQKLWEFDVRQGTVLYLALEDDYQRIQRRMFMMYGVNDTAALRFATVIKKVGSGFDEQVDSFMRDYPDTRLIIVDTLQKVREVGGETYSYAADYEIVGRLKALADKYRVCMLIVHHTRKQAASDKMDAVSGTNGINGSADGSLIMEKPVRTGLEATINVTGRDHQDQILYLKKDPITQIWNLERLENELYREPPDPVLEAVAKLVSAGQPVWTGSPSELAEIIGSYMAVNALTKYLNIRCGKLTEDYNIRYENKAKHSGRRVTLTYTPPKTAE